MPLQTSLALWIAVITSVAGLVYYMHLKYLKSEAPPDLSAFTNMKFWISTRAVSSVVTLILIRSLITLGPHLTIVLLGILQVVIKCIYLASMLGNMGFFTSKITVAKVWNLRKNKDFLYHLWYLSVCVLGLFVHEFLYCALMFDIVYREETLQNVMRSVTRNVVSILLTAVLAIILIYIYSILGYVLFSDDFILETHPKSFPPGLAEDFAQETCGVGEDCGGLQEYMEPSCETLLMCMVTVLRDGVKSGGGISDAIRRPASFEPLFILRVVYDLSFFFLVIIIIIQNLIFGVIIDTFADLRSEKNEKEDMLNNSCFICGLKRSQFENKGITFKDHCEKEHNMWNYLYYIVHLRTKDKTEFTGPESYVYDQIKEHIDDPSKPAQLEWFPRLRCMSLVSEEPEQEQNEIKDLQLQLADTTCLIKTLSHQLGELRDKMNEQRKLIQRQRLQTTLPQNVQHRFSTLPH